MTHLSIGSLSKGANRWPYEGSGAFGEQYATDVDGGRVSSRR